MYLLMNFCENVNVLEIIKFILSALKIVFIIVPIILIVFITIDFIKGVFGSMDDVKKNTGIIVKRLIYSAIIFFVPMIVNVVVNMLGDMGVNYTECITNATDERIAYLKEQQAANDNSIYNNNSNSNSNSNSSSSNNNSSSNSSNSSNKNNNSSSNSSTNTNKKTSKAKGIKFSLEDESITLGHYKSTVNTYKIVVRNSKGKVMGKKKFTYESSNPGVAVVNENGLVTAKFGGKAKITVAQKSNPDNKKTIKVEVVHSIYIRVRLKKTVNGVSRITGKKVKLRKGTEGVLNGIGYLPPKPGRSYNGYEAGDTIKTSDDYVSVEPINLETISYYKEKIYSKDTVEDFINSHNFDSDTNYLFWTSHGAQMEYMFRGSKGKWKLYKQFYVNTGDASAQFTGGYATTGVHFSYKVGNTASAVGYSLVIWKRTSSGGGTNPWHKDGDKSRTPKSHGCTRFSTEDINYLASIIGKIQGSRLIDF